MKAIDELLAQMGALGVRLTVDGERLRVSAPQSALTPEVQAELTERRADIMAFLRSVGFTSDSELLTIRPVTREGPIAASFSQQRLWFVDQLEPNSSAYHVPAAYRLVGPLDVSALEQAINEIVRRHEVLRTSFATVDGEPVQIIAPSLRVPLPVADLQPLPAAERDAEALRLAVQEADGLFDLSRGPLLRARLLRLSAEQHILVLIMHHIVTDGWSMAVFSRELAQLYDAFSRGRPSPLPELPVQYADFSIWQRSWLEGGALDGQLAYWRERLKGASELRLPTDRPRPAFLTFDGARVELSLPSALSSALKALSRREGVTLFMTLLAAFTVLLHRYTGQEEIVVGTPIANRDRAEIEDLIGFFVNTLVLRTDLSSMPPGELTFRQLLARLREVCLGAYAHQHLPFEKLVEEVQPQRDLSHNPLFQVMFALQNAPHAAMEMAGLTVTPVDVPRSRVRFDLECQLWEEGERIRGTLVYNTNLFDAATIERLAGHYETLLQGVVANPGQRLSDLPLLTEAERHQILVQWNETQAEYPRELCVHRMVEAQVEKSAEAVAVAYLDQQLSYRELNERANQLAHTLRRLGVGPDVLVGLCVERSLEMVVGQLAILKAGGAILLLDPASPTERLALVLADARTSVLLTQEALLSHLPYHAAPIICLDRDWAEISQADTANPRSHPSPHNLAYVVYTSGSTGIPKGVETEHAGLLNLVSWHQQAFGVTPADRATQMARTGFDACVWEVWPYLTAGASIHIIDDETIASPAHLRDWLVSNAITACFLPPPLAESVFELEWPHDAALRILHTGSDKLHRYPPPGLPFVLVNNYGPTEATVVSTSGIVPPSAGADTAPSIGKPIANTQVYVLDTHLQPVPIGVPGELYLGGDSLARGYLNRPGLTAERFIPHPFSPDAGARLYKTGDLVRYLPDGNLDFLGRGDYQVKIRGFRIELGEVEAVLQQHPAVRRAVVVLRDDLPPGRGLVAYVATNQDARPAIKALRSHVRERLPEYMVPAAFVSMDALPLTPNGKVDRAKLPAPDQTRPEPEETFVAPQTPVELELAVIWSKVLGLEQVGVHDSFFDLGGDSLLAAQVVSRIRDKFGIDLSLRAIFETATIAELSSLFEQIPVLAENCHPSRAQRIHRNNACG